MGKLSFSSYIFLILTVMTKPSKVVTVVDPSTDRVHRHIDNGIFLDGRTQTLKGRRLTQKHQVTPTGHTNKNKGSKDKEVEGNTNITGFCIEEDCHCTEWMEHQLERGVRNLIHSEFQLVSGCVHLLVFVCTSRLELE